MIPWKVVFGSAALMWVLTSCHKQPPVVAMDSSGSPVSSRTLQQWHLCGTCHGEAGQGKKELRAPAIAGLPEWYIGEQLKKFRSGARGGHPQDIPGMRMMPMSRTLKEDDVAPMVRFVASLPKATLTHTIVGDAGKGEQSFAICATCHGAHGEGVQAVGGPPLVNQNDWYLKAQIQNFKAKIRGGDPEADPTGYTMSPMAATLIDDAAIDNVIDYILALQGLRGEARDGS